MANSEATLLLRIKQVGQEALTKTGELLGSLADAAKWAGAAVAGFGALALKAYREQEEAVNALNQSMINQGIYTKELSDKYKEQAESLQKLTTYGDEQIIGAQAILQSYIGQREVTSELTQATLNLAAAKKMDLASAAEMVSKSIGTSTNALARQGIELKDNMSTSEKYASVIEQLNMKFGGQAEAAAMGLGALSQMKNAFSELLETVGGKLAPTIAASAKTMTNWIMNLAKSKDFAASLDTSIEYLTKGFFGLKMVVTQVGGVIGTTLAAAIESVSLLTQGQFTRAKEVAQLGMEEVHSIIRDAKTTFDEEMKMMDEQKAVEEEAKRAADLAALTQSEANKTAVKQAETAKQAQLDAKAKDAQAALEKKKNDEILAARAGFLSHLTSLQESNNAVLVTIGKAAAIAQITIATAQAAAEGIKWGMAIGGPYGPALAATFAALAWAAGGVQIAKVAGVKLAEGGIVQATPGGVPAIIGEGGKDEAVIPLEDGRVPGMGGVNITINGNVVGDEQSLYALAKLLDPAFLKLRQNNESVAFDTGLT